MLIEWRPVRGYEGVYSVSNTGLVRSERRVIVMKNGRTKTIKERVLKPTKVGAGYLALHLGANNPKYVHRLVAEAFLPIVDGKCEINHIDEDKTNNNLYNLEWVTHVDNSRYGTRNARVRNKLSKSFRAIEAMKDGVVTKKYETMHDAERDGFCRRGIQLCLAGKLKTYKGYVWRDSVLGKADY